MIPFGDVNILAVIIAAIVSMILGSLWYSPALFGNLWMKRAKITDEQIQEADMQKSFTVAFINNVVMVYFLAVFLQMFPPNNEIELLSIVLVISMATFIPAEVSNVIWEGRSPDLMAINAGYNVVSLLVSGFILYSL